MEQPYSNREIDNKFNSLLEQQALRDHSIIESLNRIEAQTIKTNGRVNSLELYKAGVVAVTALLVITIPSIVWYFIDKIEFI